jgi:recombinational DNA repair protein (RecF pathway)
MNRINPMNELKLLLFLLSLLDRINEEQEEDEYTINIKEETQSEINCDREENNEEANKTVIKPN